MSNVAWRLLLPKAAVKNLANLNSDHRPILINIQSFKAPDERRRPYRFQAAWLCHMSYHEVVEGSWIEVRGSIIAKLTALERKLKSGIRMCLAMSLLKKESS